jgi:hypothetical protein
VPNGLIHHPGSPSAALTSINAHASRPSADHLDLTFQLIGNLGRLALPQPADKTADITRADNLWQHTCFEAFIRGPGDTYYEFNFAPSRQWAAYGFADYREGMKLLKNFAAPNLKTKPTEDTFEIQISLSLEALPDLVSAPTWQLGLSAVIEEVGGNTSYWALAHPPGKPDFHHSDCFALELHVSN